MRSVFLRVVPAVIVALAITVFRVADVAAADISPDLIAMGDKQWLAGNLDDAQKDFEQALRVDPGSVGAHMKLGGLQLSRNDFGGSIQTYQRVIGLDPKNVKAWIGLGISYMHTGRHELSGAAFEEAVRIEPSREEQLAPVMARLNTPGRQLK